MEVINNNAIRKDFLGMCCILYMMWSGELEVASRYAEIDLSHGKA